MADEFRVELKDPHSDYVAVVGDPGEAAVLRGRGYTEVQAPAQADAAQAVEQTENEVKDVREAARAAVSAAGSRQTAKTDEKAGK